MQSAPGLKRENVSDAVALEVRAMIVDGRLTEGERVNEVRLAERLGVSRTPLREALSRLAAEGTLSSTPSRGYFVRPLTLEEFEQLSAVRPLLDPGALRLTGIPPAATIERLERLDRRLVAAADPAEAIALDDEWHFTLLAACPNRVLVDMIRSVAARARRYETALMRARPQVASAREGHDRIHAALRAHDLNAACVALKRNMEDGREPIAAWLRSRST